MTITEYLINIALVGLVVLQVRGRRLTVAGFLVPLALAAWAATQFLHAVPTAGNDLVLEVGLALIGGVLGALAALTTSIRREGVAALARAGALAASLWVLGIGARVGFSLWVEHGGAPAVARFSAAHHISSGAAWAAAFILMSLVEVASRTAILYLRARRSGVVIPRGGVLRSAAAAA
jgi:hypothetical protein